jgi:DNA polymerase V
MNRVFAMVDCNSFYCSCERLFNPALHNKPVIVLSNNDGCAVARSSEAKALGIPMGAPYFKYRELCEKNNVAVFSSNFALYTNISDRVMHVLRELAQDIEVYSVDEAWLDITGITQNYHQYGKFIKEEVERKVGIPVGVGIAPTKTMAKLANHIAKKSERAQGVVDLTHTHLWDVALSRVKVGDIWGIGRASGEKLNALGIKTALDFANYENEVLIQRLLTKTGLQRKKELQGVRCFELELEVSKKKVIRSSRTFGSSVYEKKTLQESLANYVSSAAEKLRRQKSVCSGLCIFIRTSPFKNTPQYSAYRSVTLAVPTKDTRKLIKAAWFLLDECYKGGFEYKKAGVELHNIVDESEAQLDLFYETDTLSDETLMHVMDEVNNWEGPQTIKSMGCGVDNSAWKMLREFKSARFTSSWHELPKVK